MDRDGDPLPGGEPSRAGVAVRLGPDQLRSCVRDGRVGVGHGGSGTVPIAGGARLHQFCPPEVQLEHHNLQEGAAPVECLNLVHEEEWVPHGTATTPQFFEALTDNITITSMFLN